MQPNRQSGDQHYSKRTPEKVRRGPDAPGAKLSQAQIAEMCAERAAGAEPAVLAEKYGISRITVWRQCKAYERTIVSRDTC